MGGTNMKNWYTIKDGAVDDIRQTAEDKSPGPEWHEAPFNWDGAHGDKVEWLDADLRRIPDDVLVERGLRTDNRGTWYSTDSERRGETRQILGLDEAPGAGWTREKPLENEAYQHFDLAAGHWVVDEEKKEIAALKGQVGKLKAEISSHDWKVIKAQRLGVGVDELYPGETNWYNTAIQEINALEAELTEKEAAA